jgi:hypothetical protein
LHEPAIDLRQVLRRGGRRVRIDFVRLVHGFRLRNSAWIEEPENVAHPADASRWIGGGVARWLM